MNIQSVSDKQYWTCRTMKTTANGRQRAQHCPAAPRQTLLEPTSVLQLEKIQVHDKIAIILLKVKLK